jgi:hypothetical protein
VESEDELRRQFWGGVRRYFVAACIAALVILILLWLSLYYLIADGIGPGD